jgi:hypothetical protein
LRNLLDQLVGALLEVKRNVESECPGCLQVDHYFELGRLFDRQFGRRNAGYRGAAAICVMEATCRRFLRKTAQTQGILRLWLLSTPQPPITMTQAGRARKGLGDTILCGDGPASCGRAARSDFWS